MGCLITLKVCQKLKGDTTVFGKSSVMFPHLALFIDKIVKQIESGETVPLRLRDKNQYETAYKLCYGSVRSI